MDYIAKMNELEDVGNKTYTCLRGPRPSAAMIVVKLSHMPNIIGSVTPPLGSKSCIRLGKCMIEDGHCVRNNHAEVDALLQAARRGVNVRDYVMLSINKPCYQCTRAIIAAGIRTIYYRHIAYNEERTQEIIEAAGVETFQI